MNKRCRQCGDPLKPGHRDGICSWCRQINRAKQEVHDREETWERQHPRNPLRGQWDEGTRDDS